MNSNKIKNTKRDKQHTTNQQINATTHTWTSVQTKDNDNQQKTTTNTHLSTKQSLA